jgi:two-component system, chemotaxis family, response regulator Rcp1
MLHTTLQRPVELLLIEDNLAEIRLFEEAFKAATIALHLSVVRTGDDALAFLRHQDLYTQAVRPDLILLDLNLPGKSGLEVLHDISAEPQLRQIPSIVITNSQAEEDIWRSYELCANCYVVKPTDFAAFQQIVTQLQEFWLCAATLPSFARAR